MKTTQGRPQSEDTSDDGHSQPKLDKLSQSRIGDRLRTLYDEVIHQPVPDRFKDLIARLDSKTQSED